MFPWMRDQLAEAWQNRKSSRTAERRSLTLSSTGTGSPESNNTMLTQLSSSPDNFSINIIGIDGNVASIAVKPDFTVERLKTLALKHFYGNNTTKQPSHFRLINSSKFKQLVDEHVINEEINECDELMLVEIRVPLPKENTTEDALKGPTEEAIAQATSGLAIRNPPKPYPSTECPADFQNEIRKILITLVQASAKILTNSSDAGKFYEILKEKLEARCKPTIDPKMVKTFIEMGYSHKKVLKALRLRKSNIADTLEWLIEHQDDPDEDEDDMNFDVDSNAPGPSSSTKKTLKDACVELFREGNQDSKKEGNLIYIADLLLESFRQYKRLDFKPSSKLIQSLLEMGFEEKDIIAALKITGNDHSNACEWLLGERRRSLQDLDEGLDPEGPIYKAIMSNPHIQLSLTNPKMLLAYLSMLETPASTNVWINDPEVSPVLSQIFKTYHAEKHALHMNRYITN